MPIGTDELIKMAEIVRMPKLSDTMTEGVVAKWHKKVGDKVKSGDLLADIETDKATMEFESFQDGILLHIGIEEGKPVPVDAIIAILGQAGEDISAHLNGGAVTKVAPTAPVLSTPSSGSIPAGVEIVRMPKLSDTMTDGVVAKWHKKVGDKVKSGDLLADIETDKATMEFESFQDGVLLYQGIAEGQGAPVESILAILGKGGEDVQSILQAANTTSSATTSAPAAVTTSSTGTSAAVTPQTSESGSRIKASPLAKAIAKEKGIDLAKIKGSGDNGRIIKSDLDNYQPSASTAEIVTPVFSGSEGYTDEPVSQMRKTIARRLLESKNGAPHFYLNIEVDMENAMSICVGISFAFCGYAGQEL